MGNYETKTTFRPVVGKTAFRFEVKRRDKMVFNTGFRECVPAKEIRDSMRHVGYAI